MITLFSFINFDYKNKITKLQRVKNQQKARTEMEAKGVRSQKHCLSKRKAWNMQAKDSPEAKTEPVREEKQKRKRPVKE